MRAAAMLLAASGLLAPRAAVAVIPVVAAESVYGNLVQTIAGSGATVTSVLRNPAQDPHLFEASPAVARAVSDARLVILNGDGYDPWMAALLAASPAEGRAVLVVADLAQARPGGNPHLWYAPATMRRVALAIAATLTRLDPGQAGAIAASRARLLGRLDALDARIATMRQRFGGQTVAATEPVFGPMAAILGLTMRDARFQLAVMNGTEPRASDVAAIEADLRDHRVRALLFNAQVTDAATHRLLGIARQAGVPVVGVTETLPAGQDYVGWMLAELTALETALSSSAP